MRHARTSSRLTDRWRIHIYRHQTLGRNFSDVAQSPFEISFRKEGSLQLSSLTFWQRVGADGAAACLETRLPARSYQRRSLGSRKESTSASVEVSDQVQASRGWGWFTQKLRHSCTDACIRPRRRPTSTACIFPFFAGFGSRFASARPNHSPGGCTAYGKVRTCITVDHPASSLSAPRCIHPRRRLVREVPGRYVAGSQIPVLCISVTSINSKRSLSRAFRALSVCPVSSGLLPQPLIQLGSPLLPPVSFRRGVPRRS